MSDSSQGPGWWQASDGKWYPPAADTPTAQQPPTGGVGSGTVAITPPGAGGPAGPPPGGPTGVPGPPPGAPAGGPPPGAPPGGGYAAAGGGPAGPPGGPPGWGPNAGGPPASGGGSGGKIALIVGIVVLVVLLIGAGIFLVTRPKDDVGTGGTGSTQTTDGNKSDTTKKKSTTTEPDDPEETSTSKKSTATTTRPKPKLPSTTTSMDTSGGGSIDDEFEATAKTLLPNSTPAKRKDLAQRICSGIGSLGARPYLTSFFKELGGDQMTQETAGKFVYLSVLAYCPQYKSDLDEIISSGSDN